MRFLTGLFLAFLLPTGMLKAQLNTARAQRALALDDFIKTAQTNSPLLNDYNNQLLSQRVDSLKLRANYGFILHGEASGSYAPAFKGWGYDEALSNGQSLFAGLRLSKELIGRNNLNTRLAAYQAAMAQVAAQQELAIKTLCQQVTEQYLATYSSQQQYRLSLEMMGFMHQEDEVLKKLAQQAVLKQTDYLAFKVSLQQNQLALQQQKADWQNNFLLLNYLSGKVDTAVYDLQIPDLGNALPSPANENSYAKAFRADSTKLANDAKIIAYDYKPKLTAFSDGGYQSSFMQSPFKHFGLSVGLALTLPLYDGHQKQLLLQQNQLAIQTRKQYFEQEQRQYQQQIEQLQNQIRQYQEMLLSAKAQISYAQTLVDANARQLPTGDVKMVDFILSLNNVLSLKANVIQYEHGLLSLKNQLKYLIIP